MSTIIPQVKVEYIIAGSKVAVMGYSDSEDRTTPHRYIYYSINVDGEVLNKGKPLLDEPTFREIVWLMAVL